jgi:hypothetical protein
MPHDDIEWGGRREPTTPEAAEADFATRLSARVDGLAFWLHEDRRGPWLLVSLDVVTRRETRTLRLDFDHDGLRGGWSPGNLNWDDGMRAEDAGVDTAPPDGLLRPAAGHTVDQLVDAAAAFFATSAGRR